MNEISVIVNQVPGKVTWNFSEIKERLEEELTVYRNTVYTDDTIKTAKGDVANLRKLAAQIEDRRKEVRDKCLEPYNVIADQAKELTSLIDKPIQAINEQVKDYEKRRKQAARAEIMAYWKQKCVELPEGIREKAELAIYDPRWENATATKKSWREGIDSGIQKILDEIATIRSFHSEFEADAMAVYMSELSFQKAVQKMNELKAQQERFLEMERQKKEKAEREEQARREAEARNQSEKLDQLLKSAADTIVQELTKPAERDASVAPEAENAAILKAAKPEPLEKESVVRTVDGLEHKHIVITGTPQQIRKICDYINFTGATFREV